MACNETLRTQSYFDRALEGDAIREAELHLGTCSDCARLLKDLEAVHKAVRENASYHRASPALRARVQEALDGKRPRAPWFSLSARPFWGGALSGAVSIAAAAAVAFMLLMPSDLDEIVSDVTTAHMRSLMGTHLVDIASNDPGVVKPWLMHHAGIAPPVANLAAEGYTLVGGRADYVYWVPAGTTVYRHANQVVNLFAWVPKDEDDGEGLPHSASSNGINVVFWKKGDVIYCAVSKLSVADLTNFEDLLRKTQSA